MISQILVFDDDKSIKLAYDNPYFEITDSFLNHVILSEEDLENLELMIREMLQLKNKRDY